MKKEKNVEAKIFVVLSKTSKTLSGISQHSSQRTY